MQIVCVAKELEMTFQLRQRPSVSWDSVLLAIIIRADGEKVRTLVCYARELHGVTVGRSHVFTPMVREICSSNN